MDYPNLPYLVDGDVKMSESLAMMKYIARKGILVKAILVALACVITKC